MPKYWTDLAHNHYRPRSQPVLAAAWGYTYDRTNRLEDADFFPGPSLSPALFITEKSIAYDLNGNITALKRYGSSGLENDLSFTHSGNRMTSLSDAHASGSGAGPKTFTYDANGNLTHDGRQDLDIRWNIFNLASGAETHDDGSLTLARLSDGTLLETIMTAGSQEIIWGT